MRIRRRHGSGMRRIGRSRPERPRELTAHRRGSGPTCASGPLGPFAHPTGPRGAARPGERAAFGITPATGRCAAAGGHGCAAVAHSRRTGCSRLRKRPECRRSGAGAHQWITASGSAKDPASTGLTPPCEAGTPSDLRAVPIRPSGRDRQLVAGPPRERFSRWDLVGGHELGGSHPRDHAPDRAMRPSPARAADRKGGRLMRRDRRHTEPANSESFGGGILVFWMLSNG